MVLFLLSGNYKSKTEIKGIELLSLTANDLSENMTDFSSKNDEIVLVASLLEQKADTLVLLESKHFGVYRFDSTHVSQQLDSKIDLQAYPLDNSIIVFTLVEMDNQNPPRNIAAIINRELVKGKFLTDERERYRLNKLLGDNDVLSIQYLQLKDLKRPTTKTINFSGMQLFDLFNYELRLKILE